MGFVEIPKVLPVEIVDPLCQNGFAPISDVVMQLIAQKKGVRSNRRKQQMDGRFFRFVFLNQ